MLSITHLTKRFGTNGAAVTAVDDVSIEVFPGEMVGVIGRSGAGKSTLLRMINRLESPSEGRIQFGDRVVSDLKGPALRIWQRDCAMIFQQFNLVPQLDVLTNVMLGRLNRQPLWASLAKVFTEEDRLRALLALERLGIAGTAMQRAGTLSGGQQQRVAIARALMQEPRVILADEPIASLDPLNAAIVMDALKAINESEGLTVMCNLHTLDTARTYCNRVIGMMNGRVVFDGPAAALTNARIREIYGAEGEAELSESVTSTALPNGHDRPAAMPPPDTDPAEREERVLPQPALALGQRAPETHRSEPRHAAAG